MCHGQAIGSQPLLGMIVCAWCGRRSAGGMLMTFRRGGERYEMRVCYECAPRAREMSER